MPGSFRQPLVLTGDIDEIRLFPRRVTAPFHANAGSALFGGGESAYAAGVPRREVGNGGKPNSLRSVHSNKR